LRKSLISIAPLAILGLAGQAHADESNVVIYGILDTAVANIQHALNFDPYHPVSNNPNVTQGTQSATGMLNGAMSATRWGIKGQEDLGDGLKAVFLLEDGFSLGSGNINNAALGLANNTALGPNMSADSAISGQFFNRGAYVGIGKAAVWGTVTFGRQQSFFLDNISIFDPMMGSQAFSPLGFSGTYGGGGATDDSRVDNSVKYRVAFGDFTLGALYKFGGVAGSNSAQGAYEVNGVYAAGPLGVQLGYQQFKDAFAIGNNTGAGSVKVTAEDTKAYMLSAKYSFDALTVRGGFEREEYTNPSNPTSDATLTSIYGVAVASVSTNPFPTGQKNLNVYWLGGGWDFSSAFSLLLGGYHVSQNAYACTTPTNKACSGSLNYYSLVGDYHFSKRTDSYFGLMESTVSGGPAYAVANKAPLASETSNRIIALGIRHVF